MCLMSLTKNDNPIKYLCVHSVCHVSMVLVFCAGYFQCPVCGQSGNWTSLLDNLHAVSHVKPAARKYVVICNKLV